VQAGLVASINRPGGNATGVSTADRLLGGKHLGLLHELLPRAQRFALLINPTNPLIPESYVAEVRAAASTIGAQIDIFHASNNREIDAAYATLVQNGVNAIMVSPDGLYITRRVQLVTLEAHYSLPAIYTFREDAVAGGLMSYGASQAEQCRQTGLYVGRVLNGEKPADLPVLFPTRVEFVINLQTARLLGLTVPPGVLAIANEVIE